MDLGKTLTELAFAPVRAGLAVADVGISMATGALDMAHKTLGEPTDGARQGPTSMAQMLGVEDAVDRANRLARLMDDDQPLGRALAPDGPMDRLLRPGGVIDRLTAPGGVLDRLTEEDGGLMRAIEPGGLVDQLLDEDGLIERVLARGRPGRPTARRGRPGRQADRAQRPLGAARRCRRHLEPAGARTGGAGADDRGPARGGDHAEPGGQPAEQHRRPDPVPGPASPQPVDVAGR